LVLSQQLWHHHGFEAFGAGAMPDGVTAAMISTAGQYKYSEPAFMIGNGNCESNAKDDRKKNAAAALLYNLKQMQRRQLQREDAKKDLEERIQQKQRQLVEEKQSLAAALQRERESLVQQIKGAQQQELYWKSKQDALIQQLQILTAACEGTTTDLAGGNVGSLTSGALSHLLASVAVGGPTLGVSTAPQQPYGVATAAVVAASRLDPWFGNPLLVNQATTSVLPVKGSSQENVKTWNMATPSSVPSNPEAEAVSVMNDSLLVRQRHTNGDKRDVNAEDDDKEQSSSKAGSDDFSHGMKRDRRTSAVADSVATEEPSTKKPRLSTSVEGTRPASLFTQAGADTKPAPPSTPNESGSVSLLAARGMLDSQQRAIAFEDQGLLSRTRKMTLPIIATHRLLSLQCSAAGEDKGAGVVSVRRRSAGSDDAQTRAGRIPDHQSKELSREGMAKMTDISKEVKMHVKHTFVAKSGQFEDA